MWFFTIQNLKLNHYGLKNSLDAATNIQRHSIHNIMPDF